MPLHQLTSVTIGVPDVGPTADYYAEFGLTDLGDRTFATIDGGPQLRIAQAPTRRLIDLTVGADDADDLDRIASALARLGLTPSARTARCTPRNRSPGSGPPSRCTRVLSSRPRTPRPTTARAGRSGPTGARPECCATSRCGR